ncbi:hypothetical protein M378DRAFT_170738 [Amanita muscaria Koide BX008]|uniref:Uncharacterized protein n=1 Tax=Amanita muscaria (strain Koide BX008) TaxID=946122 RepID=A0A0C2WNN6_AMAMK|nr:hypothetical protein M378DRAFT_170738 [Amanita muscaria Koide BX008]
MTGCFGPQPSLNHDIWNVALLNIRNIRRYVDPSDHGWAICDDIPPKFERGDVVFK